MEAVKYELVNINTAAHRRLVMMRLLESSASDGYIFYNVKSICEKTGFGFHTVYEFIKNYKRGLIDRRSGHLINKRSGGYGYKVDTV